MQEINEKYNIFRSNIDIIDLGAAPGGWSKYASEIVNKKHKIIAIDILEIQKLDNVKFIKGNFNDKKVHLILDSLLENKRVDLIISDMSPNLTGIGVVDLGNQLKLINGLFNFINIYLKNHGILIVKLFNLSFNKKIKSNFEKLFKEVIIFKPSVSKSYSSEFYLIGKNFKLA